MQFLPCPSGNLSELRTAHISTPITAILHSKFLSKEYRYCLRCTPSPGDYQGYLYCYDLRQQQMAHQNKPIGRVTFASGEQMEYLDGETYTQFFLDRFDQFRDPSVMLAATKLLHHMGRIFRDNSVPPHNPAGIRIDSKRRKRLTEKRMAMGHKADDHEEQVSYQQTM